MDRVPGAVVLRTRRSPAPTRRARWTRRTSDTSRAQSWVERAGAREALVEGDLTPPPVDPLPLLTPLSVLRVRLLSLSLSLLSLASLSPPNPTPNALNTGLNT